MLCMVELLCHSFQVKQVEKHNDYKIRCLPEDSAHVFISHIGRNGGYNAPFSKISKIHHFMEEAGEKMQRTHEKNPMSANRMLRGR